jgi:hypothetical protein
LNIFPAGLSGKERFDYMKTKENEYYKLRDHWKEYFKNDATQPFVGMLQFHLDRY